jgi:hypothetical protein
VAPQVTAYAAKVDGTTVEKAHAAMVHAKNSFQNHVEKTDENKHLYSGEGYRDQIAKFADTDAARAVDQAVAQVRERAEKASAQVDRLRRDLSPAGDAATELRATRFWNRTRGVLDSLESGKIFGAAQDLIRNADREQLGVLLQELPDWLTAHGHANDWLDTVVDQVVPEYGSARKQAKLAKQALLIAEQNAKTLHRSFANGQAAGAVLAAPDEYDPDAA